MIAHQKIIRDAHAQEHDPFLKHKRQLASTFTRATVREISHAEAKTIILNYEWLGNMGCTDFAFGLFFGEYLAGVVCFGRTAGTNVAQSNLWGTVRTHGSNFKPRSLCTLGSSSFSVISD